jgi:hypothetical protein
MRENRTMSEQPHDAEEEERTSVVIRRAPKFSVFVAVGAVLGLVATLILTSLFPADPSVGFGATVGYFALFGVPIGGIVGAAVAIVFDRRANRRAAQVVAGRLEVRVEGEHSAAGGTPADDTTVQGDG